MIMKHLYCRNWCHSFDFIEASLNLVSGTDNWVCFLIHLYEPIGLMRHCQTPLSLGFRVFMTIPHWCFSPFMNSVRYLLLSRYLNINSQPITNTSNLVWANSWRISFIQFSNIKDWSPWWSILWKYLLSFVDKYHKNIEDFLSFISTWTYSRQFHGFRVTKKIVQKSKWMLDMTCRADDVPPVSHNRGYYYPCKGTNIEKYTLRRWGHDC